MKIAAVALAGFLALAACSSGSPTSITTSPSSGASPSASTAPTPSVTESPTLSDPDFNTRLDCAHPVTARHGLALFSYTNTKVLGIVDVSNPLQPAFLCTLSPAQGGRFDSVHDRIVFWIGDRLGSVDLTSGKVLETGRLPQTPFEGVFSHDGGMFAYRAGDSDGRIYTSVNSGSSNRTLYTQEPVGGHGGTPWGPLDQLEFSPDASELLDFFAFRPASGPDTFLVYTTAFLLTANVPTSNFLVLQSTHAAPGVWSPTENTLYYFQSGSDPSSGQLLSFDSTHQIQTVASGLSNVFWPRMTPTGESIIYDPIVSTGPNDQCGGFPHLWRVDFASGQATQLTSAISSEPVFVSQRVAWSNQQVPSQCGPGGESAPDGVILAYDMVSGSVTKVDMTNSVPGVGAPQPSTREVIDVWL